MCLVHKQESIDYSNDYYRITDRSILQSFINDFKKTEYKFVQEKSSKKNSILLNFSDLIKVEIIKNKNDDFDVLDNQTNYTNIKYNFSNYITEGNKQENLFLDMQMVLEYKYNFINELNKQNARQEPAKDGKSNKPQQGSIQVQSDFQLTKRQDFSPQVKILNYEVYIQFQEIINGISQQLFDNYYAQSFQPEIVYYKSPLIPIFGRVEGEQTLSIKKLCEERGDREEREDVKFYQTRFDEPDRVMNYKCDISFKCINGLIDSKPKQFQLNEWQSKLAIFAVKDVVQFSRKYQQKIKHLSLYEAQSEKIQMKIRSKPDFFQTNKDQYGNYLQPQNIEEVRSAYGRYKDVANLGYKVDIKDQAYIKLTGEGEYEKMQKPCVQSLVHLYLAEDVDVIDQQRQPGVKKICDDPSSHGRRYDVNVSQAVLGNDLPFSSPVPSFTQLMNMHTYHFTNHIYKIYVSPSLRVGKRINVSLPMVKSLKNNDKKIIKNVGAAVLQFETKFMVKEMKDIPKPEKDDGIEYFKPNDIDFEMQSKLLLLLGSDDDGEAGAVKVPNEEDDMYDAINELTDSQE